MLPKSHGVGNRYLSSREDIQWCSEKEERHRGRNHASMCREQTSGDLSGYARKTVAEVYERICSAKCSGLTGLSHGTAGSEIGR